MKLPFQSIHIFRPSLLIGEREETRAGEKAAEWLCYPFTPLLRGSLEKYRPIKGITVAQAMIRTAIKDIPGIHIYDSKEIQDLIKNK